MKKLVSAMLVAALLLVAPMTNRAYAMDELFGGLTEIFGKKESKIYGVGETAEIDGVEITLDRVMESTGGKDAKPKDGNVFLICEFSIENNTSDSLVVSTMLCFSMKIEKKLYELSLDALSIAMLAGKAQFDRVLEIGEKGIGVVGYEVPKDWETFELRFTPDPFMNSGKYAVFAPEGSGE